MITIGVIVEGDGEVTAVPILIRRIAELHGTVTSVRRPHRVPRGKLAKDEELRRAVELTARHLAPGEPILILLDADNECAAARSQQMLACARAARADREIAVVFAVREFEAWFLAAIDSLRGRRGIFPDASWEGDPEGVRDAKGALRARSSGARYSPTIDQAALVALMDVELARARSSSFDKLYRDVLRLLGCTQED